MTKDSLNLMLSRGRNRLVRNTPDLGLPEGRSKIGWKGRGEVRDRCDRRKIRLCGFRTGMGPDDVNEKRDGPGEKGVGNQTDRGRVDPKSSVRSKRFRKGP